MDKPVLLGDHIRESTERLGDRNSVIYSVTNDRGFVKSLDQFDKQVFSADRSNYKLVRNRDIAYNPSRINVGSVALCNDLDGGAVSPMYVIVRCENKILPEFLVYYLKSAGGLNQIRHRCEGTVRFQLKFKDLQQIPIFLPWISEQERIVRLLDAADELRQLRAQADRRSADLIPALFHDMFGDPSTNPKAWPVTNLGAVTTIDAPMVDPRLSPYLNYEHVGAEKIEKGTGRLLSLQTAQEESLISSKFLYDDTHVLYCKIRPVFRKVALPSKRGLCSADIYPVRPDLSHITREYLWAVLLSESFTQYALSVSKRANMPKVNREQFMAYNIALPPLDLQQTFAAHVAEILALAEKQAISRLTLDALFQSMLHRAFNGELTHETPNVVTAQLPTKGPNAVQETIIAYCANKLCGKKEYGRIMSAKLTYLADAHVLSSNSTSYKEAAGPLLSGYYAREAAAEQRGWLKIIDLGDKSKVTYERGPNIQEVNAYANRLFGSNIKELDRLIGIFSQLDTHHAELYATTYAVWNDLKIKLATINDDNIIKDFYAWSESKEKFTQEEIKVAINWLKTNNLVPKGTGRPLKKK